MELLQIISLGSLPLYDKHYIGINKIQVIEDPFIQGTIHPVVKRLEINRSEGYLDYFQELISYSEEFGEEQGYITQSAIKKINLVSKAIYEELIARKGLVPSEVESIATYSKVLENTVRNARNEYISYLSDLGYIEEEIPHDENDTVYLMIHPLYIHEWRKYRYPSRYPNWAVKEIGYFPDK